MLSKNAILLRTSGAAPFKGQWLVRHNPCVALVVLYAHMCWVLVQLISSLHGVGYAKLSIENLQGRRDTNMVQYSIMALYYSAHVRLQSQQCAPMVRHRCDAASGERRHQERVTQCHEVDNW